MSGGGDQSAENDAPRPPSYLTFEGMCWPNPTDPAMVQWRLRYGSPSHTDLMVAASFMHAYAHLIDLPRRERDQRVSQIRDRVIPPASTGTAS